MLAISSFKPMDSSAEIARNQLRANQSWLAVFSGIVLFGDPEPRLHGEFIPSEQFPKISLLVAAASLADEPAAILNCDIVVTSPLRWAAKKAFERGAGAITSRRYEFTGEDVDGGRLNDHGIDFFCAWPHVWRQVLKIIPDSFRLGVAEWDQWMLGAFNHLLKKKFVDVTPARAVFHPKHGNRGPTPAIRVDRATFVGQAGMPAAFY